MANQKLNNIKDQELKKITDFLVEKEILVCDEVIDTYKKIKDVLDEDTCVLTLKAVASKKLPLLRQAEIDKIYNELIEKVENVDKGLSISFNSIAVNYFNNNDFMFKYFLSEIIFQNEKMKDELKKTYVEIFGEEKSTKGRKPKKFEHFLIDLSHPKFEEATELKAILQAELEKQSGEFAENDYVVITRQSFNVNDEVLKQADVKVFNEEKQKYTDKFFADVALAIQETETLSFDKEAPFYNFDTKFGRQNMGAIKFNIAENDIFTISTL